MARSGGRNSTRRVSFHWQFLPLTVAGNRRGGRPFRRCLGQIPPGVATDTIGKPDRIDAVCRWPSLVKDLELQRNWAYGVQKSMTQLSGKTKTPKSQKIKLAAKNPRKIKAALKSWVEASEKNNSDLLELDKAPAWVENALAEAAKTILPGNRLPASGEWDMGLLGELLGRQQALGKLYGGEISMGPESEAECDRAEKFAASLPESPERSAKVEAAVQDLQTMIAATNDAIPQILKSVLSSSHEDALKFQTGLLRGMKLEPDELTTGRMFERHTRTFWVLGTGWRFWVKCTSLREVYDHLCKAVGEQKIGSFKTFEKICKKIGFRLRGRGRPSNK